ncbi:uridine 5'-monophosphate synthase-like [Brevipalpus obovatus]|uniref:uridine 5'-monophosphate synthase-like n=1 Tax=Brevipalpus obovatus TaxID=246614 RepID=UPI003D9EE058
MEQYLEQFRDCKNLVTRVLLGIIKDKKSNLCLSADLQKADEILEVARELGPHIAVLKIHHDIIQDFSKNFIIDLRELAGKHHFLVMEDRKFADIGNTVIQQYTAGYARIEDWADLVTVHLVAGPGCVESLKKGRRKSLRSCLLIVQMSSSDNLLNKDFTDCALSMINKYPDFVSGFISQSRVSSDPTHIHFTPGVHLNSKGDSMGQQYVSPEEAVVQRGADLIVVGRGILDAPNRLEAAIMYKQRAFSSYCERVLPGKKD